LQHFNSSDGRSGVAERLEGRTIFRHGEEVVLEVRVRVPCAANEVPINEEAIPEEEVKNPRKKWIWRSEFEYEVQQKEVSIKERIKVMRSHIRQ